MSFLELLNSRADPVPEAPTRVGSGEGNNRSKVPLQKFCRETASNPGPVTRRASTHQLHQACPSTVKFKEAMKMDCALCYDVLHGTEFRSCPNRASKDPICNVPYTLNILIPTPLILFCLKFLLAKKGQGPTTVKSHLSCGIMGALS
jgi:hypothetical protein